MRLNQVTVPAADIAKSVNFYVGLGLKLIVSSPHYARFECPDGDSTFSVHLVENLSLGSQTVVYFECADLDAKVSELKAVGYTFEQDLTDQTWLWREARLRDPAHNEVCLYWAGENRRYPPWRVAGGKRLRTAAIADSLGCSQATAKRELDFLRSTGAIEFIGPSKTGGYQLRLVMSE